MEKYVLGLVVFASCFLLEASERKIYKSDSDKFEAGDTIEFKSDGPTLMANHEGWVNNENTNACVLKISYFKPDTVTYSKQPLRILHKNTKGKGNRTFFVQSAKIEFVANGWTDAEGKSIYSPNIHYEIEDSNDKFNEILCRPTGTVQLTYKQSEAEKKNVAKYLDKIQAVKEIFKGQSLKIFREKKDEVAAPASVDKNSEALDEMPAEPKKAPKLKEKPRMDL